MSCRGQIRILVRHLFILEQRTAISFISLKHYFSLMYVLWVIGNFRLTKCTYTHYLWYCEKHFNPRRSHMTVSQTGVAPCSWNKSAFPYEKKNLKSCNIWKAVEEETRCCRFYSIKLFYRETYRVNKHLPRNCLFLKSRMAKKDERRSRNMAFEKKPNEKPDHSDSYQ